MFSTSVFRRGMALRPRSLAVLAMLIPACSTSTNADPKMPDSPADHSAHDGPSSGDPGAAGSSIAETGETLQGAQIDDWFTARGAKKPGSLGAGGAECKTVRAPVPSETALWCEQHSAVDPFVRVTRTVLFDVRNGRTLILLNLPSKVEAFDGAASGADCGGAIVRVRIQLSDDGRNVQVSDAPGCDCGGKAEELAAQAESVRSEGRTRDAQALEMQAREVTQACAARGAYEWEEHGFVPAGG